MDNGPKKVLNLCQINICDLSKRSRLVLDMYANTKKMDIIAVQETKSQAPGELSNFNVEYTSSRGKTGKQGGCALYVHKDITQKGRLTKLEPADCDVIWMLIKIGASSVIVGTAYIQPNNTKDMNLFLQSCDNAVIFAKENNIAGVICLGDFNARDVLWKDTETNVLGKMLREHIGNSKLSILSPDTPTFAVAGKGTSVIDLVLVSDEIGEWCKYTCT